MFTQPVRPQPVRQEASLEAFEEKAPSDVKSALSQPKEQRIHPTIQDKAQSAASASSALQQQIKVSVEEIESSPPLQDESTHRENIQTTIQNQDIILTIEHPSEHANATDEESPAPPREPWDIRHQKLLRLWITIPALNTISDAFETANGLIDAKRTLVEAIIAAITRAVESASLNGAASMRGFHQTVHAAIIRALPDEWAILSKRQEGCSFIIALPALTCSPIAESMEAYCFIDTIGSQFSWPVRQVFRGFGITVGAAKGLTAFCGDGIATYNTFRSVIAHQPDPMPHAAKYIGRIIGYPLALSGAFGEFIEAVGSIATVLEAPIKPLTAGSATLITALGFGDGVADLGLKGPILVKALQEFIQYCAHFSEHYPHLKEILVFVAAFAVCGWLAYAQMDLIISMLQIVQQTTGISLSPVTEQIFEIILGGGTFLRDTIVQGSVVYNLLLNVINIFSPKLSSCFERCLAAYHRSQHLNEINTAAQQNNNAAAPPLTEVRIDPTEETSLLNSAPTTNYGSTLPAETSAAGVFSRRLSIASSGASSPVFYSASSRTPSPSFYSASSRASSPSLV